MLQYRVDKKAFKNFGGNAPHEPNGYIIFTFKGALRDPVMNPTPFLRTNYIYEILNKNRDILGTSDGPPLTTLKGAFA